VRWPRSPLFRLRAETLRPLIPASNTESNDRLHRAEVCGKIVQTRPTLSDDRHVVTEFGVKIARSER
jgi:hypothetical protein